MVWLGFPADNAWRTLGAIFVPNISIDLINDSFDGPAYVHVSREARTAEHLVHLKDLVDGLVHIANECYARRILRTIW